MRRYGLLAFMAGIALATAMVLGWLRLEVSRIKRTHLPEGRVIVWEKNGLHNRYTWVRTTADTSGEYIQLHNVMGPGAFGTLPGKSASPPVHIHDRQVECFTLIRGTMGYLMNGTDGRIIPEDTAARPLCIPPGIPHTFWNDVNTTELEFEFTLAPALQGEEFFRTLAGFEADFNFKVSALQVILTFAYGDVRLAEFSEPTWGVLVGVAKVLGQYALGLKPFYPEYTRKATTSL